jgi:nucleoside-diphosphate-sugar epimerase
MLDEVNQIMHNYKQAILNSGVKKIVHLSSIGAHKDKGIGILKFHYYAEKVLCELPDEVSIKTMRPAGFYYNLLSNAQIIKQLSKGFLGAFMALRYYGIGGLLSGKRGVIVSNVGEDDINLLVSPLDIASAIVEEMEKPFHGRSIRYIASEEMKCNEVAKVLGNAIGKPYLKWGRISDKQLLNAMKGMGMDEGLAQSFVEMQASSRGKNCVLYEDYYRHRPVLGKTKLKEYSKEFAKVYNQN